MEMSRTFYMLSGCQAQPYASRNCCDLCDKQSAANYNLAPSRTAVRCRTISRGNLWGVTAKEPPTTMQLGFTALLVTEALQDDTDSRMAGVTTLK
jgi:hypothetical protein